MKEIIITSGESGQRFDKFLGKYLHGCGRSFLYKMLRKKNITLNGKKASGSELLSEGDLVKLFFSDETLKKFTEGSTGAIPVYDDVDFETLIIYEDEDIILLNKPAGILSQKSKPNDVSLCEYLISYLYHSGRITDEDLRAFTPSVANRLDRNTSGLITAGKTLKGLQTLSEALRTRKAEKFYLAAAKGRIIDSGRISGYLTKDSAGNTVSISDYPTEGSAPIDTEFWPVSYGGGYTLVRVRLLTGKTHQIRAALAHIGHPIAGDPKYGSDAALDAARQMLHSYELLLNGKTFVAPLPADFALFLKKYGIDFGQR